jgi:hypothetical protein
MTSVLVLVPTVVVEVGEPRAHPEVDPVGIGAINGIEPGPIRGVGVDVRGRGVVGEV